MSGPYRTLCVINQASVCSELVGAASLGGPPSYETSSPISFRFPQRKNYPYGPDTRPARLSNYEKPSCNVYLMIFRNTIKNRRARQAGGGGYYVFSLTAYAQGFSVG